MIYIRLQLHVLFFIFFSSAYYQMNYVKYEWTTGSTMCLCPYTVCVLAHYEVLMLRDLDEKNKVIMRGV